MVGVTNRSMAAMSGAWLRRKVDQPWDGGPHRLTMYFATLGRGDAMLTSPEVPSSGRTKTGVAHCLQSDLEGLAAPQHMSPAGGCSRSSIRLSVRRIMQLRSNG